MMKSAIVISLVTALALGAPAPDPFSIGLGVPAVVVDGHPIKVPERRRDPADDIGVKSRFSIGDHTIEAGGGAVSIGGHAKGGSVGNVIQPYFPSCSSRYSLNRVRTLARQSIFTSETLNPILT
jgi:hypothetical protein